MEKRVRSLVVFIVRLTEFGLALAVVKGALLSIVFNQFAPSFRGWLPAP
jgi:hypothetical protein